MYDISRVKIFHPKSHLVYQRDFLGSLTRWSLEVIDDVPITHCLSAPSYTSERSNLLYGEISIQGGGPVALDAP
jgi:hypothetical protein